MNTDQVVEMINAITEGNPFRLGVETDAISLDDMSISTDDQGFSFLEPSGSFHALISNPRTAREIAGALVAWAARKEGNDNLVAIVKLFGDGKIEFPSVNDLAHIKAGRDSRANWYARSVKHMGQEAKDRNLKDLIGIMNEAKPDEVEDVFDAIQILRDNGAKDV